MSEILLTWLNTEVDLSRKVLNMEKDFANGYLLGELLYKFNQLTNFRDFQDGNDRDSKINNFKHLQRVLKNIEVDFDGNVATDIMNAKKGRVLTLLYQVRSKLEKKGINPDNLSLKKANHLAELYSSMKFRKEIPQYDKFSEEFFNKQLQSKIRAQKEVNLEKHLEPFDVFKKLQDEKIANEKQFQELKQKTEVEERVRQFKSEGARLRSFQQQFEQKGIDDWKKNMLRMKDIQKKDLDFQIKEAEKFQTNVYKSIKASELDFHKKIDTFEKHLKSLKSPNVNGNANNSNTNINCTTDNIRETTQDYIDTNSKKTFASVLKFSDKLRDIITQKIMSDQTAKKERNRRRRKIIVEQSKAQLEIENRRREEHYIQKLFKQSNQEKQLIYETFRVNQIKNVIIEDRKLRDAMYKERKEMDATFFEKNEEEFLKFHKENFEIELQKEEMRRKDMKIALKQKKRSNNTNMLKEMVDLIIDIAEEAYVYQQTNDAEEIDLRVWREWTQVFINNQSVQNKEVIQLQMEKQMEKKLEKFNDKETFDNNEAVEIQSNFRRDSMENVLNTNMMSNYNTKYGNTFYSAYTNEPNYSLLDKTLDDCEFVDYILFLGQWEKGLIPSNAFVTINLSELMSDPQVTTGDNKTNAANAQKKPVAPGKDKKNEEEFKEDDLDNLLIPNDTLLNTYLGDLIDILVDMKYAEEEDSTQRNFVFNQVPIKISLIGHDFAGKKTQSNILSENFPFKIYIMEQIILNAIELLNHLESPIDLDQNEFKQMRTKQYDEIQKERKGDEAKYAKIKDLAKDIRDILKNGKAITDDIYVELLIEFIKLDFPVKNEENLVDEIYHRVKRKEEIQEELERNKEDKIKRPKSYNKLEQELTQELMKISLEASKGFVIVNFPNTYNQAKILENKISSYTPENEKPLTKAFLLKENYALILDKSPKIIPTKKLIKGGLDYIFWLDVPPSECIRRATGRRTLPKEIKKEEREFRSSTQFTNPLNKRAQVEDKTFYHLEDNPPPTTSSICERLIKIEDSLNSESSLVTRHISFDNTINSIVDFYEPFGFGKENRKMFLRLDGNKSKDYVTNDLIEHLNKLVEINEQNEIEMVKSHDEQEISVVNITKTVDALGYVNNNNTNNFNQFSLEDKTLENMNSNFNMNNEEEEDELTIYNKKIEKIKKALNKDLSEILIKIWSRLYENYVKECKGIFKFLRLQRDALGCNYNQTCQKFIEFLKRPSKKQTLVLDFQLKYNKFIDEYQDLIDDHQVKEEHHQEVDDLNDKIYEIIETRKNEAIEERKKIMTAGWIENEMEKFYLNLERIYQAEIDKFLGSLQIIRDYYHNLDNRPLVELPFQTIDILKEEIDPTPLENETDSLSFPKVEKLYKSSLKVQFQYDQALNTAEKLRLEKLQETSKKAKEANKQGNKKNVNPELNVEEKKEVFLYEEEMRQAIKNEKGKYRFRITLLKFWGVNCLKNIRKMANVIYGKLEDWIILSVKAENEALSQLTNILKSHIEKEHRIKYELELDTFDVIVNMDVQNFIELPPKPHPAKEIIDHTKFNITQLKILLDEMKTYQINGEYIRTSTFIDIFIKKYISSKNDNDIYYGIPNLLKHISFHNYFKFIKHLDPLSSDFLNVKYIGTYFCLLNSKICLSSDEEAIRRECEKYINIYEDERISRSEFVKLPMWFDQYEDCPTLDMYESYNRPERLKEILFEINKEDEEYINMGELLKIFTLKVIQMEGSNKIQNKTYFEVLFH